MSANVLNIVRSVSYETDADVESMNMRPHLWSLAMERGLTHFVKCRWRTDVEEPDGTCLGDVLMTINTPDFEALLVDICHGLVGIEHFGEGMVDVVVAGATKQAAALGVERIRELLPEAKQREDQAVTFTFHTSKGGSVRTLNVD